MTTQDIVETSRREVIQEGVKQGVARGIAASLLAVHEARFGTTPDDLRAAIEGTRDEAILHRWLELALAGNADGFAAAIRAARTS